MSHDFERFDRSPIVITDEAAAVRVQSILVKQHQQPATPEYLEAVENITRDALSVLLPNTRMWLLAEFVIPALVAEVRTLREAITSAIWDKESSDSAGDGA